MLAFVHYHVAGIAISSLVFLGAMYVAVTRKMDFIYHKSFGYVSFACFVGSIAGLWPRNTGYGALQHRISGTVFLFFYAIHVFTAYTRPGMDSTQRGKWYIIHAVFAFSLLFLYIMSLVTGLFLFLK